MMAPLLPSMGSVITAAISSPRSAKTRSSASGSFQPRTRRPEAAPAVMPVVSGTTAGAASGPAFSRAGWADQWMTSDQPW